MRKRSLFRFFKTSPEIIRLAVMLYVRFPLSLRNMENLLHERGIEDEGVLALAVTPRRDVSEDQRRAALHLASRGPRR